MGTWGEKITSFIDIYAGIYNSFSYSIYFGPIAVKSRVIHNYRGQQCVYCKKKRPLRALKDQFLVGLVEILGIVYYMGNDQNPPVTFHDILVG